MPTRHVILDAVHTKTATEGTAGAGAAALAPQPYLVLMHCAQPARLGARLRLSQAPLTLGRLAPVFGGGALDDRRASSRHVELRVSGAELQVRDLGSKNGTFVRGSRVEHATLQQGEVLQVGGSFLLFRVEPAFLAPDAATLVTGISYAMARTREVLAATATHTQPVMVVGPSGAGKERVAREVHRLGGRTGPFVAVNCSTLGEALGESALFGHVRGAFTGATRDRTGLFQQADGGTLFLDEVATLPAGVQPKLLRVLQEGVVRRLGDERELPCKPRVVCATNENMPALIAQGRFREDLYARLHGSVVPVPALQDRPEDLGYLARRLLDGAGHGDVAVGSDLMWALLGADWPMNVRGLEQCLLGNAGQAKGGVLGLTAGIESFLDSQARLASRATGGASDSAGGDGPAASVHGRPDGQADSDASARRRVSRPAQGELEAALRDCDGRVGRVAQHFGVRRQQIYRWTDAYGIDLASYRDA